MASVVEHLNKLREERQAREKARIEKLRELNLKKYNKPEVPSKSASMVSVAKAETKLNQSHIPKNNFHVNGNTRRPITAPVIQKKNFTRSNLTANNVKGDKTQINEKSDTTAPLKVKDTKVFNKVTKYSDVTKVTASKVTNMTKFTSSTKIDEKKVNNTLKLEKKTNNVPNGVNVNSFKGKTIDNVPVGTKFGLMTRKSFIPKVDAPKTFAKPKPPMSRKSLQPPRSTQSVTKVNPNRQSVFERLYQPKIVHKKEEMSDTEKIQTDPNYLKKVIKNTGLILNKRHTCFEGNKKEAPVRRSISAVHFKRLSKSELSNCIHKWSSIGDKLDKVHLKNVDEDASVKEEKIVSAVKSERKKVQFRTPVPFNFNTPKPEELQSRLQKWLQKRGKSIDSYHHLQCFGIHLAQKEIRPVNLEMEKLDDFDDEDKENQPLESDSDNESFKDNMNNKVDSGHDVANKWRRASNVSDSVDFNETMDTTLTSTEMHHVDELLLGALNDLTELLRENYEWEQCARWLRALRSRFPHAVDTAAYWECRAALEERRGDLPASVHCWEEAIAKGTERSVVEANLDQLLTKFMQLKISPNSGKEKQPDRKMVDVKNVFKSTLIRFAVQQAKLRQSQDPPKYTVTPVRRSGRLSQHWSAKKRTPLQVCSSVKQAGLLGHPLVFVPNDKLCGTP